MSDAYTTPQESPSWNYRGIHEGSPGGISGATPELIPKETSETIPESLWKTLKDLLDESLKYLYETSLNPPERISEGTPVELFLRDRLEKKSMMKLLEACLNLSGYISEGITGDISE